MFTLPMTVKAMPRVDVDAAALASKSAYDPPDASDAAEQLAQTREVLKQHANLLVDRIDADTRSMRAVDQMIPDLDAAIASGDAGAIANAQAMADELMTQVSEASPI